MTSEHQRRANAANAKLSTGPKSDEGKAAASRNALKHGAYARIDPITAGLLGEDPDEIQAIVDGVLDDLEPANTIEQMSATTVAARLIGQHRVSKLLTPLVDGLQPTVDEHLDDEHRQEYWFAETFLAAIDNVVECQDGSDLAPMNWFFLERQLGMRVPPEPGLEPSRPVVTDDEGVPREPDADEQWLLRFIQAVFERFESWDEARLWAEMHLAAHELEAIEELRRSRLAETERLMEGLERFGPIQDSADRRLTRALANHDAIRRQSASGTP